MTVAYLRISTEKQHLRNQQEEILRFADARNLHVDRWLTEVVSGRKSGRERKLGALLRRMKRGDTLIVTELSRLSRTLTEIMSIMGHCLERGIVLYSTKDGYAFDNSINSKVLCFAFGLVAEIERNLISMRTREALAVRRADGVTLGRRKGTCVKQQQLAQEREAVKAMLREGCTLTALCRRFGVSAKTFHRVRQGDAELDALYRQHGRRRGVPEAAEAAETETIADVTTAKSDEGAPTTAAAANNEPAAANHPAAANNSASTNNEPTHANHPAAAHNE